MKRRAPPKCLDIPRARIPLRFFLLTPGALSLCPQILKEKEMREREREKSAVQVTLRTADQNLHLVKMMILSEARLGLSLPGCPWQDSSQLSMLMRVMTCSSL